jgi:transposase InsO family protein
MLRPEIEHPNTCWSMDFVVDSLFNGRRFRSLTIVEIIAGSVWQSRLAGV